LPYIDKYIKVYYISGKALRIITLDESESILSSTILQRRAMDILEQYEGANNYILYLQQKKLSSKKFYPTRSQADYIITYHNMQPKVARKWVELDTYFAKKFAEERYLLRGRFF